jgi:hypothetical protein
MRQSTCALVLPHPSVTSDRRALWNVGHPSVNTSVSMAGLSVYPSVIVVKCRNFLQLCEIPTGIQPSVIVAIFLQVLFVLRVYPPAQKFELQTYITHNTITRGDNYKINISCFKISSLILHYKNQALQHI